MPTIKHLSIIEWFKKNAKPESTRFIENNEKLAHLFTDEIILSLDSKITKGEFVFLYEPKTEKVVSNNSTLLYKYTYIVSKYDDVSYKLTLKNFETILIN